MSIASYAGEFTVSPIPLEMSMNYCSMKCSYCFANLNQPGHKLDVNKSINQIKNCHKSKSLTSYLLANEYPVLLSNRVDPFALTNCRQSLSFIEMFYKNGNKICFQTKGGKGIDEALAMIEPSQFYISISFWNDELRKKIEPGAPSIQERFDLIEKLLSKGHKVSVGINPLVEEWLPYEDFENLLNKLEGLGVKNYWVEVLHLNKKQIGNMTAKEKAAIGDDVLREAKKRDRNTSYFRMCLNEIRYRGLNFFSMNQPFESDYFNTYHETYKEKTLPTHQDFINYCFEKYPNGGEVKFHEYYKFMAKPFYEKSFSEADGYAYRIARNVYKREVETPLKTLRQVLEFYWNNVDVSKSLAGNSLFSVECYQENGKLYPWLCKENDMIILKFHAKLQDKWETIVD